MRRMVRLGREVLVMMLRMMVLGMVLVLVMMMLLLLLLLLEGDVLAGLQEGIVIKLPRVRVRQQRRVKRLNVHCGAVRRGS